jgi:CRISPR-associated protein Csd1
MILQALHKLAEAENLIGDPDFEYKSVSWVVILREDGTLVQIADHRQNVNEGKPSKTGKPLKATWVGRDEEVPRQPGRTSGDLAFFLVDKAEYALGVDPTGKRPPQKLITRLGLFLDLIRRCAQDSSDAGASAVARFLENRLAGHVEVPLDPAVTANDLFAFRIGLGGFVHDRPAVREWFRQHYGRKPPSGGNGTRCLVTGAEIDSVGLFPLVKRVPGGTPSGNALVSFNDSAYRSFGFGGNDNAPISADAAQHAAAALNRLLDYDPIDGRGQALQPRRINLSGDTAVVFWSTKPAAGDGGLNSLIGLVEADNPDRVADAYQSIWHGRPPIIGEDAPFYALTLSGTQGRVIIRDWFEATLKDVLRNLAQHFADLEIVRNTRPAKGKPEPPAIPLRRMLDALAAPGREASVPAALASEIWTAALRGAAYPTSLLGRILLRERAEAGGDEWIDSARRDARAALLKGVLIRRNKMKVTSAMNEDTTNPGYLLGRLLAVLEDTQRLASGGVNATIKDKYYGSASATPAAVFPQLMDLFHKHARKARDAKPGATVNREKLVDAILAKLDPDRGIPVHMELREQGMFVLGYHQQRYALYNRPKDEKDDTNE